MEDLFNDTWAVIFMIAIEISSVIYCKYFSKSKKSESLEETELPYNPKDLV